MIKCSKIQICLFISSLFLVTACNSSTNKKHSLKEKLANAEYPIEITKSGKAKLSDGTYEEQAAPGSATKTKVSLLPKYTCGDLNNDGKKDAAVILVGDGGGSGTFYYVSAVLNKRKNMIPVDSKFLGDRIKINSIKINDGEIVVELMKRSSGEPMSSTPSKKTINKFQLKNNSLYKISE
jgi:hypothetical protein